MTAVPVLLFALTPLASVVAAAAHPQHVTLAEAEWNAKAKTLEVSLAITPAQLEECVERHAGRSVDVDADEAAVAAWLKSAFVVLPAEAPAEKAAEKAAREKGGAEKKPRTPAPITFVGQELGVSKGFVYFEVSLPGGWEGAAVTDRVRLLTEPRQHNTLVLSVTRPGPGGTPRAERATYTFDRDAPTKTLRAKDLRPLKTPPKPAAAGR